MTLCAFDTSMARLSSKDHQENKRGHSSIGGFIAARGPWNDPEVQRVANRVESDFQGSVAFA